MSCENGTLASAWAALKVYSEFEAWPIFDSEASVLSVQRQHIDQTTPHYPLSPLNLQFLDQCI